MPIYEFYCNHCESHHERYYPWRYSDGIVVVDDPAMELCPECSNPVEHEPALTVMRPDSDWGGKYYETTDYYTTSRSRYDKWCKENGYIEIGDRTDRESLTKMAQEADKAKDKKYERDIEKSLDEYFQNKDDWGVTGTVKERNRKERKIREVESEHPEDVCDDPVFNPPIEITTT